MKIQLNGIIKDYSAQEVKALQQQGHSRASQRASPAGQCLGGIRAEF